MDPFHFLQLRKRLAFLLAKATCEVFPDAQIVTIQGTSAVFYADVCFSQDFERSYLPLIEERMRPLVKQNPSISSHEMVPASARGLLERDGQELQAAQLPDHPQMLVEVASLGTFALLAPDGGLNIEPERYFWEIIGAAEGGKVEGRPVVRIMGIAFTDLAGLKEESKTWSRNPYVPPGELAASENFLAPCEASWVWLPRGEVIRQELQRFWQERLVEEGFAIVATGGNFPFEQGIKEILSSSKKGCFRLAEAAYASRENEDFHREGILTPLRGWTDRCLHICDKGAVREVCISSLQFILQIPRILGFDAQVVLCSSLTGDTKDLRAAADAAGVDYLCEKHADRKYSSIEVRIGDRLGRWWTGPSLWVEPSPPGHRAVFASCLGKWERLVGLLIEREGEGIEQFVRKLGSLQREQEVRFEN